MFEFGSDSRSEAGRTGINNKGMVSYDRTLKKDVYYFFQANWSDEPTLHINSKRFEDRYQDNITAKIYANMDSVELIVNGESQGVLNAEDVELHKFTWGSSCSMAIITSSPSERKTARRIRMR